MRPQGPTERELLGSLRRIADSQHAKSAWARSKIERVHTGEALTELDIADIRLAEAVVFPVYRVAADDMDPEYAAVRARGAIPIAELLGIVEPQAPRVAMSSRRRLPVP